MQRVYVRSILVDPRAKLVSSADGPVAWDDDIDVARHALEQPQRGEVVPDRVGGAIQVEHRNQDIRKHVAGDQDSAFLDQQRRVPRGMRLMLDDSDRRTIPWNLRRLCGQACDEAEQVEGYLLRDAESACIDPAGQTVSGSRRAARGAVSGYGAEPGVPEQVIPMRMRREACHHCVPRIRQVARETGHFVLVYPGVDEQYASPALDDDGVALAEHALVNQHSLRNLRQHEPAPTSKFNSPIIGAAYLSTPLGSQKHHPRAAEPQGC